MKTISVSQESVTAEFGMTVQTSKGFIKLKAAITSDIKDGESASEAFDRCYELCYEQVESRMKDFED